MDNSKYVWLAEQVLRDAHGKEVGRRTLGALSWREVCSLRRQGYELSIRCQDNIKAALDAAGE